MDAAEREPRGKQNLRALRQAQQARKRLLTIGAAVIGALLVGAFALRQRPHGQLVAAARLSDDPSLGPPTAEGLAVKLGGGSSEAKLAHPRRSGYKARRRAAPT